jgi:hypothetical protein
MNKMTQPEPVLSPARLVSLPSVGSLHTLPTTLYGHSKIIPMVTIRSLTRSLKNWFSDRHGRALYELACNEEANAHYGVSSEGLVNRLWEIWIYTRRLIIG